MPWANGARPLSGCCPALPASWRLPPGTDRFRELKGTKPMVFIEIPETRGFSGPPDSISIALPCGFTDQAETGAPPFAFLGSSTCRPAPDPGSGRLPDDRRFPGIPPLAVAARAKAGVAERLFRLRRDPADFALIHNSESKKGGAAPLFSKVSKGFRVIFSFRINGLHT